MDPLGTLKRCRQLLCPGGLLIVTVPNFAFYSSPWDRVLRSYVESDIVGPGHLYYFTETTLTAMLKASGFVEVRRQVGFTGSCLLRKMDRGPISRKVASRGIGPLLRLLEVLGIKMVLTLYARALGSTAHGK